MCPLYAFAARYDGIAPPSRKAKATVPEPLARDFALARPPSASPSRSAPHTSTAAARRHQPSSQRRQEPSLFAQCPRVCADGRAARDVRGLREEAPEPPYSAHFQVQKLRLGGDALGADPTYLLYLAYRSRGELRRIDLEPDCAGPTLNDFAASESARKPLLHTRGISRARSFDLEVTPWAPTRLTSCISHPGPEESSGASTLPPGAAGTPIGLSLIHISEPTRPY